jgi:hypothetical protein
MLPFDSNNAFYVSFFNQRKLDSCTPLLEAVSRFADVDVRWIPLLEVAAGCLTEKGRYGFALALNSLTPGPAPFQPAFVLEPDTYDDISEEVGHMTLVQLTCIGTQLPIILDSDPLIAKFPSNMGHSHPDVIKVEGLITAIHRHLRLTKTRP